MLVKLPEEIFRLEQVYQDAMDKVLGKDWDKENLSAFEFVNMCIYYNSESYPTDFAIKLESIENTFS